MPPSLPQFFITIFFIIYGNYHIVSSRSASHGLKNICYISLLQYQLKKSRCLTLICLFYSAPLSNCAPPPTQLDCGMNILHFYILASLYISFTNNCLYFQVWLILALWFWRRWCNGEKFTTMTTTTNDRQIQWEKLIWA